MDTALKNHTEATMGSVSYVGMDVHKDTVDMVVMREDSQEPTLEDVYFTLHPNGEEVV